MATNWRERKAYMADERFSVSLDRFVKAFRRDGTAPPGLPEQLPAKASAVVFARECGIAKLGPAKPIMHTDRDGKPSSYAHTYHPFPVGGFGVFAVPGHRYMIVEGPPDRGTPGGRPGWEYYQTWTQGEEVEPGLFELKPPEVDNG